ncbi:MAG: NUDIX hydrolase [Synechococcales bacterium]|nr:NUDIX hydrolase [Synechococcales bacterium]
MADAEFPWPVQDRFLELHSRWLTLIGEHLQDHQGNVLEYWRIEKADSVIVLPLLDPDMAGGERHLLLPARSYRPGVGAATLDFPGGRVAADQNREQGAIAILQRELGFAADRIRQMAPLNAEGWPVNSSFSNQRLYGFVAHLHNAPNAGNHQVAVTYPATAVGIQQLLQQLTCLQCRAVLLEWWWRDGGKQRQTR